MKHICPKACLILLLGCIMIRNDQQLLCFGFVIPSSSPSSASRRGLVHRVGTTPTTTVIHQSSTKNGGYGSKTNINNPASDELQQHELLEERIHPTTTNDSPLFLSRRRAISLSAGTAALTASSMIAPTILPAAAAESSSSVADMLLRLRSIPTFVLVDPSGIPFMIFDGQASATGYFFLSFDVAKEALQDARTKDKATGAKDIWDQSRIIVMPLASAIQLTLRAVQREAMNAEDIKLNTFNEIIASLEGIEDARNEEKDQIRDRWSQKGRIPLFYFDELRLADGREPRYFNRKDLIQEWKNQHGGDDSTVPKVQLVELVDLYRKALASNSKSVDAVSNLTIVPVKESSALASKLVKSDGPLPSYDFKKAYLVSSSK